MSLFRALGFGILAALPAHAFAYWPTAVGPLPTMPAEGPSSIVGNLFDFFIIISSITAICMLIYSGILYITSMGVPAAQKKARDFAVWALIGLVIVFLAFAIVTTVTRLPLFSATGTLDTQIAIDPADSVTKLPPTP